MKEDGGRWLCPIHSLINAEVTADFSLDQGVNGTIPRPNNKRLQPILGQAELDAARVRWPQACYQAMGRGQRRCPRRTAVAWVKQGASVIRT